MKNKKEKSVEEALWDSCNALRGSVDTSEYKYVVLGLLFLKFANDKFSERRKEIVAEGHSDYLEMTEFYSMKNVFYLKPQSRWDYLIDNAKQSDIAIKIDTALSEIEKDNPSLKGALPDNYYSRLPLESKNIGSLLDEIGKINTLADKEQDIIGRVYEYFLKKFAISEGKSKGEFYTPKSVVKLICELIQPYKGKIYDPACGSGGMFVQSIKFVEQYNGSTKDVSVYGQEKNDQTLKLAKMNLAIRGITADFGEEAASTFTKDQHKNLKADFIMANPPFNQSSWRAADELVDDERWNGYDVPPEGNANYGWILNIVSKLSRDGVAGFLLANGSLSGGGVEHSIRSKLIENHLVDAILYLPRNLFYTTDIGVSLWIISNNKKARMSEIDGKPTELRDRENEILFVDLRQWGSPFEKKYIEFTDEDISKVEKTYHDWESMDGFPRYKDVPEYCKSVSLETIRNKEYSLVPSEYIEFINNDENVDYDVKMKELQERLQVLLKEDQQATEKLIEVMKELGYEIKL